MCIGYHIGIPYEEIVDEDIRLGLLSSDKRQQTINQMYKGYNDLYNELFGETCNTSEE